LGPQKELFIFASRFGQVRLNVDLELGGLGCAFTKPMEYTRTRFHPDLANITFPKHGTKCNHAQLFSNVVKFYWPILETEMEEVSQFRDEEDSDMYYFGNQFREETRSQTKARILEELARFVSPEEFPSLHLRFCKTRENSPPTQVKLKFHSNYYFLRISAPETRKVDILLPHPLSQCAYLVTELLKAYTCEMRNCEK
jgi:hypothetical protein